MHSEKIKIAFVNVMLGGRFVHDGSVWTKCNDYNDRGELIYNNADQYVKKSKGNFIALSVSAALDDISPSQIVETRKEWEKSKKWIRNV